MYRLLFIGLILLSGAILPREITCAQPGGMNDSIAAWNMYHEAYEYYTKNNPDDAKALGERILQLSIGRDDFGLLGNTYFLLGRCSEEKEEFENAIIYYIRASGAFEKTGDDKQSAVFKQTGSLFNKLGMYEKSAEYYLKGVEYNRSKNKAFDPELTEDLAYAQFSARQYAESETHFMELLDFAEKDNNNNLKLRTLYNLAEITLLQKKYPENLGFNRQLLTHFENLNDKQAAALIANNMGYTQLKLSNQSQALASFQRALNLGEESGMDNKRKSQLMSNIGICYQNLGETENSLKFLRQAVNTSRAAFDFSEMARLENITAQAYLMKKDLHNAGIFSQSSIKSARKSEDNRLLVECYHTYSQILKQGNDHIKALEYYELYLSLRDSLALEQRLAEQRLAQRILDLEKSEKDLKLVLADEELKDLELKNLQIESEKKEQELELLRRENELETSERQRILQSLELTRERHEAEIRQREIQALGQQREIQDLLIKQKEAEEQEREKEIRLLENEKELQQLEIEKEKETRKFITWMLALLGAIIILVLASFFVVRKKNKILAQQKLEIEDKNYDLEQKNEEIRAQSENLQTAYEEIQTTNEMLEQKSEEILTQNEQIIKQKELIEDKNKNITDSILYASRIQNAVLPPENFLDGIVSESFLIFKPKDIVSGDFYWSASKGKYHIIAAADCTGHGVPGAFMSMLGMTLLNEIVIRTREITASVLLEELRSEVIHSLKQRGAAGETKDGMDISLCVIDTANSVLHYAGANNPLYHFRSGDLSVLSPDKMPIGISHQVIEELDDFTNHELEIKPGDFIYLFTDGFADQFGGPAGKKFKYNQFREVLKKIHQIPVNEQKAKLEEYFEKWKGDTEQIDDVLIIGVKF